LPFTISPKYHSDELRSFLSACLVIDPEHRATATELLNHPFILKHTSCCPRSSSPNSKNPLAIIPDSSDLESIFDILLARNAKCNLSPTNLQQIGNMGIDWSMNGSFVDSNKSAKAIASAAALDDIDALAVPVEEENTCDYCETQHFTPSLTAIGTFELDETRLQHLASQFAISPQDVRRRLALFQKSVTE
jgi:serine/threonine protein kinase